MTGWLYENDRVGTGRDAGRQGAIDRALLSLDGLSVGDAFGECFGGMPEGEARAAVAARRVPARAVWPVTDDTLMAIGVVETLARFGGIVEPRLAEAFARRYHPGRGYGTAMHALLPRWNAMGTEGWADDAKALFGGRGSFGNGSAMRVAPLGAYFADDLDRLRAEAERSARVTHWSAEAVDGAIAVAIAAALAWRAETEKELRRPAVFLETIRRALSTGAVRDGVERALGLPVGCSPVEAAAVLGNGSRVRCADTAPFVLWSVATAMEHYEEALWRTVSAGGDRDTMCAMVGGVVVLRTGADGVPGAWRRRREGLAEWMG